jgi:hypothetical protein
MRPARTGEIWSGNTLIFGAISSFVAAGVVILLAEIARNDSERTSGFVCLRL